MQIEMQQYVQPVISGFALTAQHFLTNEHLSREQQQQEEHLNKKKSCSSFFSKT